MLVKLSDLLGLIEELRSLSLKCKAVCNAEAEGPEKEKALAHMEGRFAMLDGLAKLLQDPRFRGHVTDTTPADEKPAKLPRLVRGKVTAGRDGEG